MPIALIRPRMRTLEKWQARAEQDQVTYSPVGATGSAHLPDGYAHTRQSVAVGNGVADFERSVEALRGWRAHHYAGAVLSPPRPGIVTGATVLAVIRVLLVFAAVPCRIVYVTDEDRRFGFAYGTLPGHPERGEEAFHVRLAEDGVVTFEIVAFSRPASLLARMGHPVNRLIQGRVTRRYLEGVRTYVANPTDADAT
jgi:uncharacterized protein (UPF0548 family)